MRLGPLEFLTQGVEPPSDEVLEARMSREAFGRAMARVRLRYVLLRRSDDFGAARREQVAREWFDIESQWREGDWLLFRLRWGEGP